MNFPKNMKKKTTDYLHFINLPLYQDDEMFCVNSDTVLLGMSLPCLKGKTVLDVGTNNGALLLYAAHFGALELSGIDINEKALALAKENLAMNAYPYRELKAVDLRDFKGGPYDVIVCNPPFFCENNKRFNSYKAMAMFEENLPLKELLEHLYRLLKDNGSAYMIFAGRRLAEFYDACKDARFKIMTLRFVYDRNKEEASRFLVHLKKGKMTMIKVLKPFYIEEGEIIM